MKQQIVILDKEPEEFDVIVESGGRYIVECIWNKQISYIEEDDKWEVEQNVQPCSDEIKRTTIVSNLMCCYDGLPEDEENYIDRATAFAKKWIDERADS